MELTVFFVLVCVAAAVFGAWECVNCKHRQSNQQRRRQGDK
jgi:hypothetical protein